MATVYGGQGLVAGSPIPPGMPGHQPDIGLKYDVEAAKAELATALQELGYASAADVPTLSFGFNTQAGHDIPAAYMQDQWLKNLGIKSELKGDHVRHLRRRAPAAQVLDRPERLGRGLPAPGQLPPRAVPQPERQQRRGVQQPRVRPPGHRSRQGDSTRPKPPSSTTRPRSSSSRMRRRSSPAGGSGTTRSGHGSRASRRPDRTRTSSATCSSRTSGSRTTDPGVGSPGVGSAGPGSLRSRTFRVPARMNLVTT